ncbi:hypothetical protein CALCODRAFT_558652 [Calocera cornea HHB12733]|uniref:Uncharacterized protein n=1 Tax=Calocera cornea HHB12733 TaxID=1353952 RepID=A0A165CTB6_9BASI|nr:hypothetical protein CALCODRAFT_558652 [Calocera cornea HHB12733]
MVGNFMYAAHRVRMSVQILLQQARDHVPLFFSHNVFAGSPEMLFTTTSFLLAEQEVGESAWYCAACKNICALSAFPNHTCKENILTVATMYALYPSTEAGRSTIKIADSYNVLKTLKDGSQQGWAHFRVMWFLVSRAQMMGGLHARTIRLRQLHAEGLLSPEIPQVDQIAVRDLLARDDI